MYDELDLFDVNDTIVFNDNKIILQKQDNTKHVAELQKQLKELDGNWELELYNSDKNVEPIDWVEKNENDINILLKEVKLQSISSDILSEVSFSSLSDYLEISSKSNYKYVNSDWDDYEEYKLYGMKKPTINEWTSFHVLELHKLYSTYYIYFKLGHISEFIRFCFENSLIKRLPQY